MKNILWFFFHAHWTRWWIYFPSARFYVVFLFTTNEKSIQFSDQRFRMNKEKRKRNSHNISIGRMKLWRWICFIFGADSWPTIIISWLSLSVCPRRQNTILTLAQNRYNSFALSSEIATTEIGEIYKSSCRTILMALTRLVKNEIKRRPMKLLRNFLYEAPSHRVPYRTHSAQSSNPECQSLRILPKDDRPRSEELEEVVSYSVIACAILISQQ